MSSHSLGQRTWCRNQAADAAAPAVSAVGRLG